MPFLSGSLCLSSTSGLCSSFMLPKGSYCQLQVIDHVFKRNYKLGRIMHTSNSEYSGSWGRRVVSLSPSWVGNLRLSQLKWKVKWSYSSVHSEGFKLNCVNLIDMEVLQGISKAHLWGCVQGSLLWSHYFEYYTWSFIHTIQSSGSQMIDRGQRHREK